MSEKWDPMTYMPDMEQLDSDLMEQVLSAAKAMDTAVYSQEDVCRALAAEEKTPEDFAALLSPVAAPLLEEIAQAARAETRKRFGNGIYLFTPLYIANHCDNHCVYCGFHRHSGIRRARLNAGEIEAEMDAIARTGLREILILTGESLSMSDVEYIGDACQIASRYFQAVGLEIYPVDSEGYARLRACGADFITVFQETYDPVRYGQLHLGGRKRVYPYRFYAQERAVRGGIRGVGFAALLGLADFRRDAFATGMHAWLLQRKYPHAEIAFSCPRLRPVNGRKTTADKVSEAQLLQVMMAYRLFLPCANITISSRESARFRDHVVDIAATKISAGVDVGIGGHTGSAKGDEQFDIDDARTVEEIAEMLSRRGLQPILSEYVSV